MSTSAALLLARLCSDDGPPPRTVLVAAHPDDEVLSAGDRLGRLGVAVTIVHVTDGSPADGRDARDNGYAAPAAYAAARRAELVAAVAEAGVGTGQLRELGCPDQRASFELVAITRLLADLLGDLRPEVVLTHPYEGGHPDHDATAFAVAAACERLRARSPFGGLEARASLTGAARPSGPQLNGSPAHLEFTSYHIGLAGLTPYAFLPSAEPVTTVALTPAGRTRKRRMFNCFPTQQGTLQYFPVEVERFRVAPRHDFARPPHDGTLFYEQYSWGVTGSEWRELAAAAAAELGSSR